MIRYALLVLVGCALSLFLFSQAVFAQEGRGSGAEQDASLYKQLLSGKKMMQDRKFVPADKPTVYLTFDDGPSKLTPQVLDILKKEQVLATFFVCGDQVTGREDILKRIAAEGHAVGNHTYDHTYKELYSSSFEGFWNEIQRNERLIEKTLGFRPSLIRAPGGTATNFDAFYFYWLDQAGYVIYDWNIDSGDSRRVGVPAKEIISTVKNSPLGNEVTVLMHDGSGHAETVKALESIISYFKDKGYAFAPLTTEVKPAQFGVAKSLKWTRSVSEKAFSEVNERMRQFADAHAAKPSDTDPAQPAPQQTAIVEEAATARLPEKTIDRTTCDKTIKLSMSLAFGAEKSVDLGAYSACFAMEGSVIDASSRDANSVEVPLRDLAERLGARVQWFEENQTVRIQYGFRTMEYDTVNQTVRMGSFGEQQRAYWPYIRWVDERLYISINRLFELLHLPVQSTASGKDRIHVEVLPAFDVNQHFPGKGYVFVGWNCFLTLPYPFYIINSNQIEKGLGRTYLHVKTE